jgi:small subunit ribosomal protein S2
MTISIKEMMKAGVHFGHQTRYWSPKMAPYLYGARSGIHIINLEKTREMFDQALAFVQRTAATKGKILFVGTKRAASSIIAEEASRCGMPYINHRWLGGMLTNYKTIRQSVRRLHDLTKMIEKQSFGLLKKKEILNLMREHEKLERNLGGIKKMGGLPDVIFIIDAKHEHIAIEEAKRLSIPVIAIVDSNTVPQNVDYLIPGNDDSRKAIRLYAKTFADTILASRSAQESSGDVIEEFIEIEADVVATQDGAAVSVDATKE